MCASEVEGIHQAVDLIVEVVQRSRGLAGIGVDLPINVHGTAMLAGHGVASESAAVAQIGQFAVLTRGGMRRTRN